MEPSSYPVKKIVGYFEVDEIIHKSPEELWNSYSEVSGISKKDFFEYFKDREIAVGTTTIYRQLEKMVKEGLVEKYVVEGTNSACFEYIGESETSDYESCYHCKCEKCGKLIHIQCDEIECLSRHMTEHHDFQLDPKRTVFYGICNECRKNT